MPYRIYRTLDKKDSKLVGTARNLDGAKAFVRARLGVTKNWTIEVAREDNTQYKKTLFTGQCIETNGICWLAANGPIGWFVVQY